MRALLFALLLTTVSATAQEFPTKGPATHDPASNSSQTKTYQGCLLRADGGVMLNSFSNQQYRLTGAKSLDSYVGQEVKIVAHDVNPNDPSSDERGAGNPQQRNTSTTLVVENIEKVSDSCQAK